MKLSGYISVATNFKLVDFKLVNQLVLLYPKPACAQDLYDAPASTFNTPLKYCCSQWSLPSN